MAEPASFPADCRVFIDDVDVTPWLFGGRETITPTELKHRWGKIDISLYVKGPGLHKLKVTAESGVGRLDARLEIG